MLSPLRCLQACHHTLHHCLQAFDELLLMKRGGYVIYQGPLGEQSSAMLEYFEVSCGFSSSSDTCSHRDCEVSGALPECTPSASQLLELPAAERITICVRSSFVCTQFCVDIWLEQHPEKAGHASLAWPSAAAGSSGHLAHSNCCAVRASSL